MQQHRNILLLLVVSVILTVTFIKPFYTVSNDLSTRVNGSRLLMAGKPAYFHQWQPGESVYFADPFARNNEVVNGNTVTPALLGVFSWLHALPFKNVAYSWWLLSFVFLAGVLFFAYRAWRGQQLPPYLFIIPLFFIATAAWRMHLYSGQVYVFYALLAAAVFYLLQKRQLLAAGIVAGLLVTMRLPVVLLLAPLVFMPQAKRFVTGAALGVIVCLAAGVLMHGLQPWQEYFAAMKIHALELENKIPLLNNPAAVPASLLPGLPGVTDPGYVGDTDIFSVQKLLLQLGLPAGSMVLYGLYGFTVVAVFVLLMRRRGQWGFSVKELFLAGFALYILSEYFLPAPRFTYNFMQWLLPFCIILFSNGGVGRLSSVLAVMGLLFNIIKLPFVPDGYCLGELLLLAGLLVHLAPVKDVVVQPVPPFVRQLATRAARMVMAK